MSEPTHSLNVPIITDGDMTTTINSLSQNLDEVVSYSIQAEFTGSPSGTLQLQCSNDNPSVVSSGPTNWTIVTDSIQGITAAGSYVINVELPAYSWVRLQYVPTSGSGTLNAR